MTLADDVCTSGERWPDATSITALLDDLELTVRASLGVSDAVISALEAEAATLRIDNQPDHAHE